MNINNIKIKDKTIREMKNRAKEGCYSYHHWMEVLNLLSKTMKEKELLHKDNEELKEKLEEYQKGTEELKEKVMSEDDSGTEYIEYTKMDLESGDIELIPPKKGYECIKKTVSRDGQGVMVGYFPEDWFGDEVLVIRLKKDEVEDCE